MAKKDGELSEETTSGNNDPELKPADKKPAQARDLPLQTDVKNAHASGDGSMGKEDEGE